MSSCPKGCVNIQGLGFTFVVMIIAIFTVIMSVSNCIVYVNLIKKDDGTIAKGWSIFLLVLNIILAIIGFIAFFWTLYKFFKGRSQIKQAVSQKYQAVAGPEGYIMRASNQANEAFQRKIGYVPSEMMEQVQPMQQVVNPMMEQVQPMQQVVSPMTQQVQPMQQVVSPMTQQVQSNVYFEEQMNPFSGFEGPESSNYHSTGIKVGQMRNKYKEDKDFIYLAKREGFPDDINACSDGNQYLKCPPNQSIDIALNRLYTQFYSQ